MNSSQGTALLQDARCSTRTHCQQQRQLSPATAAPLLPINSSASFPHQQQHQLLPSTAVPAFAINSSASFCHQQQCQCSPFTAATLGTLLSPLLMQAVSKEAAAAAALPAMTHPLQCTAHANKGRPALLLPCVCFYVCAECVS